MNEAGNNNNDDTNNSDQAKLIVTGTIHNISFYQLSPTQFEQLCMWLVISQGYVDVEHYGQAGSDGGRDLRGYEIEPNSSKRDLWYFQCKRTQKIDSEALKREVDKILGLVQKDALLKPVGIKFIITCSVSAGIRDEVRNYCEQNNLQSIFIAETELDHAVHQVPSILHKFFLLPSPTSLTQSATATTLSQSASTKANTPPPNTLSQELEEVLVLYLKDCFRKEQYAHQEAGESENMVLTLQDAFVDLDLIVLHYKFTNQHDALAKHIIAEARRLSQTNSSLSSLRVFLNPELSSKVALIAGPGQGKSTVLQQLAQIHRAKLLDTALASGDNLDFQPRIPLRIILKSFAQWLADKPGTNEYLEDYLITQFPKLNEGGPLKPEDVFSILKFKSCLVLLDGLDEVMETRLQTRMFDSIQNFLERAKSLKADVQVITSSRPLTQVAKELLDAQGFSLFELLPLSKSKAQEYADKWIKQQTNDPQENQRVRNIFMTCLEDARFQVLLTTPLQVSIVLRIIKEGGNPPTQREALFEEYWRTVLKREKSKETAGNILLRTPDNTLFKLHAYLGYIIHSRAAEQEVSTLLSEKEFRSYVRSFLGREDTVSSPQKIEQQVERLIRETGERIVLITKPASGFFSFELRSFQEFFAASYIVQKGDGAEQRRNILRELIPFPHWRNVVLFMAGHNGRTYEPEQNRNIFLRLCEDLDKNRVNRYLRPGGWLALEVAAEGAFEESRNLQKELLEYGLNVLSTGLTLNQMQTLTRFCQRLSVADRDDILRGLLVSKIESLSIAGLHNALRLYDDLARWDDWRIPYISEADKGLFRPKLEILLRSPQTEYSTPNLLEIALSRRLNIDWIVRHLKLSWPVWGGHLMGWWEDLTSDTNNLISSEEGYSYYYEDYSSEERDDTKIDAHLSSSVSSSSSNDKFPYPYIERLLARLSITMSELDQIASYLLKANEFGLYTDIEQSSLTYSDLVTDYTPGGFLIALVKLRSLVGHTLETQSMYTLDLNEDIGGITHIQVREAQLQPYLLPPSTITQIEELLQIQSSQYSQVEQRVNKLHPALNVLLWVLYWNVKEPDEVSVAAFLQDVETIKESPVIWSKFVQQLDAHVRLWPLFSVVARSHQEIPNFVDRLRPHLVAQEQYQYKEQLTKAIDEDLINLSPEHYFEVYLLLLQDRWELAGQFLPHIRDLALRFDVTIQDVLQRYVRLDHPMLSPSSSQHQNLLNYILSLSHNLDLDNLLGVEALIRRLDVPEMNKLDKATFADFENLLEIVSQSWLSSVARSDEENRVYGEITLNLFLFLLPNAEFGVSSSLVEKICLYLAEVENWRQIVTLQISPVILSLSRLESFLISAADGTLAQLGMLRLWMLLMIENKLNHDEAWDTLLVAKNEKFYFHSSEIVQLAKRLLTHSESIYHLLGIVILTYSSQYSVKDQQMQEVLKAGLQLDETHRGEKRLWLYHLQNGVVTVESKPEWLGLLQSILSSPQIYRGEVLSIAMERLIELTQVEDVTFSKEKAKELGLD